MKNEIILKKTTQYFDCSKSLVERLNAMIRHYSCIEEIEKNSKCDDIRLLQLIIEDIRNEKEN